MTGKWKLAYTTPEGAEESTADLTMAPDGTLTGTLTSKRGTGTILRGYLSVDKFNFVINIPIGSEFADVTFSGTFDGTAMKGNISVQGYSIDFTGTKPTSSATTMAAADFRRRRRRAMRTHILLVVAIIFSAAAYPCSATPLPDAGPVILIQNATILTVSHGTIEHGSILIKDGKIAEVGRQS